MPRILAADVMGYSRHTERNEEASTVALRMYRAVVEESISAHRGHIFSSAGDGVVAEFPSIVEAIRCAIEIQDEIAERNTTVPEDERMQFRIGVNLGDVVVEDNNLYGTGVNIAVRLEQLAEPGGICISQTVYDQVRKIVEIPFQDIGERRLKNISDPVHVYRVLATPLPWFNRLLSPANIRRRAAGVVAVVLVLLLALAAVSVNLLYFHQPLAPWVASLFGNASAPLPERPSIAVLPFDDMSPAHDQQYLADGIAETLITGLTKFHDLIVMARNSTFTYKDKPTDIRQVGKDLNVRYVVEGSLQRSNNKMRVTAQLIDATTGSHLWADRYDRELENIFTIQDDITRSIAGALGGLQGEIGRAEAARLASTNPNSFTAYDYYLKGLDELYRAVENEDRETNLAARGHLELAKKIDPNYARVYAALAWTYEYDYDFGWTDDYRNAVKQALGNATEAVRLDPYDYQGHWVLGWASLYSWDHQKATASYERARTLNPNDAELLAEMGNFLVYVGQPQRAVDQLKEAIRLNPKHERWYVEYLGWAYEHAGMPKEAIETLEPVIDQPPTQEQLWLLPTLAAAYANPEVGQMDDAHKIVKEILQLQPDFSTAEVVSRAPYRTQGQIDRYVNGLRRAGLPE